MPQVIVQRADGLGAVPGDEDIRAWAEAALPPGRAPFELVIRVVDEAESRELNRRYRHQDRPTNVLSFRAELAPETAERLRTAGAPAPLGDLVICAPLVQREAEDQGKPPSQHWAHLVIHGVLHLLGHDHQQPAETQRMEALEVELLGTFGIDDPYRPR